MKLERLLDALRKRRFAGLLILLCLLLMSISLTVRPSPQLLTLQAEASAARLRLEAQALFEGSEKLKPGGLVVGSVHQASIEGNAVDADAAAMLLRGPEAATMSIERISFAKGSELSLASRAECLTFTLGSGEAELDAIFGPPDSERSLSLRLRGEAGGASELVLCPVGPLQFTFYGVSEATFERRYQPNSMQAAMVSSITSARLSFPRVGTQVDSVPLEGLRMEGMDLGRPLLVEFEPAEAVRFSFVGTASEVTANALGSGRSLLPRLIDHLVGRSPAAALLAAFGFFWSLIWGLIAFWRSSAKP